MNNLTVIKGVECFIDQDGIVRLNLEHVARGLGITTVAKSGNECVRWARVDEYLTEIGFSQEVGKTTFISEPIFYMLAMKASNETAREFQRMVAYEILPSIRKTGTYIAPTVDSKMMFQIAQALENKEKEVVSLTAKIESDKPKVLFANSVCGSTTTILIRDLAKLLKQNGFDIGEKRLFELLRNHGFLITKSGKDYNSPTQKSMDMQLMEVKETSINHAGGSITVQKTPLITGKGQQYFINKFLIQKGA